MPLLMLNPLLALSCTPEHDSNQSHSMPEQCEVSAYDQYGPSPTKDLRDKYVTHTVPKPQASLKFLNQMGLELELY